MLKHIRHSIINSLWEAYRQRTPQIKLIEAGLKLKNIEQSALDHFAVIDLPGPYTGIPFLKELFACIGYIPQGRGYLPDKQNDFLWMTEEDSFEAIADTVQPQVVVADFRLDELPPEIKKIIEKYGRLSPPCPLPEIQTLARSTANGNLEASKRLLHLFSTYLTGRDWPCPTVNEFKTVHAFNELLAWVLVFGRQPNHFTLSVHLLPHFQNLESFHRFIEDELKLSLNYDGGVIKGNQTSGIAQGSTLGVREKIQLADGAVELPTGFVEFVWRYPLRDKPIKWNDYFTGFVAQHANHVIESLYVK